MGNPRRTRTVSPRMEGGPERVASERLFIGGSRTLRRLDGEAWRRIDCIMAAGATVLIGESAGVDFAVQAHLSARNYPHVEVYCAGDVCRNNLGDWPIRSAAVRGGAGGPSFFAAKDPAMAEAATGGLMIWDGRSFTTLMNACRLAAQGKPVAVHCAAEGLCHDLPDRPAWERFLAGCPPRLREGIARMAAAESRAVSRAVPSAP